MLAKIIFKNFRTNLKKYILFFLNNIVAIAELFLFWSINDIVQKSVTGRYTAVTLFLDFRIGMGLIAVVCVLLMVYAMQYYIRLRMKDYTLFVVLGMRRRTSILLMLLEYSFGCIVSLAIGLLAGRLLLGQMQGFLHYWKREVFQTVQVSGTVYRNTCILSLVIMVLVFLALEFWMEDKDLSQMIVKERRKEILPKGKKCRVLALMGILMTAGAAALYQGMDIPYIAAHFVWLAGMILSVYFGLAAILEIIKGKEDFYNRHILYFAQIRANYQKSLLIIITFLTVYFFSFTYLAVEISALFPLEKNRENYSYDAVWYAQEKDTAFTKEITDKYQGEVRSFPMVRMTTYYDREHIGISALTYEKLTGKTVNLEGREIMTGIEDQNFREEKQITKKRFWEVYGYLYVGKYEDRGPGLISDNDPEHIYDVQNIVTQNVIGQYSVDRWTENVIVMSNDYFEEVWGQIRNSSEESSVLQLFNFPDDTREKACAELKTYNDKYGVKTNWKMMDLREQTLYVTEEFLEEQEMRSIFSLVSKLFILGTFCVSGFFVMIVRALAELDETRQRYRFLGSMGMRWKRQKKLIRFETSILPCISMGSAMLNAVFYLGAYLYQQKETGATVRPEFWQSWVAGILGYILINYMIQYLFGLYIMKRVEKEK